MIRRLLALVLVAAGVAACAPEGRLRVVPAEELPQDIYAPPSPTPTPAPPRRISVFFVRADVLEPVPRDAPGTGPAPEFALRALISGPTLEEQAAGLSTAVPAGAELLAVAVEDGVASVNLSKEFELSAEQRILVLRLGQVVYTLTNLARVRSVRFFIDGEPVGVIGQDGATHEVVTRADYSGLVAGEVPAAPPPEPAEPPAP